MSFYLIGLGLNEKSLTLEALEAIKKSKKVYLEKYTVDFPYKKSFLEKALKKNVVELPREKIESEKFLNCAKKHDIALLVYGDALSATTHSELILYCRKNNIHFKIFHNASILTAVAETGLQMYKFGKTASIPAWKENWEPNSFAKIIKNNLSVDAHTLILADIGLNIKNAKEQLKKSLENEGVKIKKIVLCSNIGTEKAEIIYAPIKELPDNISLPYCFIIPGKLHFIEEEFLSKLAVQHKNNSD